MIGAAAQQQWSNGVVESIPWLQARGDTEYTHAVVIAPPITKKKDTITPMEMKVIVGQKVEYTHELPNRQYIGGAAGPVSIVDDFS